MRVRSTWWCTRLLSEVDGSTCRFCGNKLCKRSAGPLRWRKRASTIERPRKRRIVRLRFSKLSRFLVAPAFLPGSVVLVLIPFCFILAHPPAGLLTMLKFLPLAIPLSIGVHELGHLLSARATGVKMARKPILTPIGIGLRMKGRARANHLLKTYSGGPAGSLCLGLVAGLLSSNPFFHALSAVSLFLFLINSLPGMQTDGAQIALLLMRGPKHYPYLYAASFPVSTSLLVPLTLLVF